MRNKITVLILLAAMSILATAQDVKSSNFNLSVGADFASAYLWRGIPQGTGPAIQPWGELSYKNFTLGVWASNELGANFDDVTKKNISYKELDLYAKYTYSNFSLLFVDLFFPDYNLLDQNFFNFKNATTGHASELALSFNGSENIPFSVYGGVILYGTAIDPKVSDASVLNHSSYFEINYLGKFKDYSYNIFAGFTPTESVLYYSNGFSVLNVGLSAKKAIKVTTDFSIPIKLTLATNPESKRILTSLVISL